MLHFRTAHLILSVVIVMTIGASPALAHGWLFVAPPPPPAAVGGADAPEHTPVGGSNGFDAPQADPNPTDQLPAPPASAPPAHQAPRPTGVRSSTNGALMTTRGDRTGARRTKKMSRSPWLDRLHTPWTTVFPVTTNGYEKSLFAGIKLAAEDGGWRRRAAPSLVFVYDASNEAHQKLANRLNRDGRFVAASQLFNCYRIAGKKDCEAKLAVFDDAGKQVGQLQGRRAHRAFKVMQKAYDTKAGRDLRKVVPTVANILEATAYCDHHLEWMEKKIICVDCGHEREDVIESIDQMTVRKAALNRTLTDIKSK